MDHASAGLKPSVFLDQSRWLEYNHLAFTIDQRGFEVSPGHCLIVPRRVVVMVWEMTTEEWLACLDLLARAKTRIDSGLRPDGYNIGVNCGVAAGQSIGHAHIHLIPRYSGDHPNPRGGVRAVIPEKADWTKM